MKVVNNHFNKRMRKLLCTEGRGRAESNMVKIHEVILAVD